jgi:hypothetical protein
MNQITQLIDEVFDDLKTLGANFATAHFHTLSDEGVEWVISLIKYNDLDDEDTEQESFHGTEQSVTLEGNMETIGEHLLSNYPLENIKWGHFNFHYSSRSITNSVEFK